jgi:hypothetical protein
MSKSGKSPAPVGELKQLKPFHPFADIFPLMEGEEFKALVDDIGKNGLNETIALFEGKVLDGRNRERACAAAEVKPRYHQFRGTEADARAYVVSMNIRRRHLKPADKRKAIKALLKADPSKSDLQIAKTTKSSPTTVGKVRSKMEKAGDVSKVETRTDTKGRRQVARKPRRSNRATKKGRKSRAPALSSATTTSDSATTAPAPTADSANEQDLVAKLQDEKRQLEIKCLALEGEVMDVWAENTKLKAEKAHKMTRVDAGCCSFCGKNDVHKLISSALLNSNSSRLKPAYSIICNECVAECAEICKEAEEKAAAPSSASNSTDGWEIKTGKYVNGWSYFATDGSVSLNNDSATLFETQEEAQAAARKAIEKYVTATAEPSNV